MVCDERTENNNDTFCQFRIARRGRGVRTGRRSAVDVIFSCSAPIECVSYVLVHRSASIHSTATARNLINLLKKALGPNRLQLKLCAAIRIHIQRLHRLLKYPFRIRCDVEMHQSAISTPIESECHTRVTLGTARKV